jgi:chromosome segregation ATPase
MLSIPELSVMTHDRKADHSVLVLEPLRPRSGLDPVILTPGRYTIGSSADCKIILHSHRISPRHCLIIAGRNQTILKAWNSQTRINETPVDETILHAGDRLAIGPIEFQIHEASQKKLFNESDQTETLKPSVRKVEEKHMDAVRNRSRRLCESPFGSKRFSRALVRVIETRHPGESVPAQAGEHAQMQSTLDSVEKRLCEREQDLNQQIQDLEECRTEFEKQRSDQESLFQAKKRDLKSKQENLEKQAENFRTQTEDHQKCKQHLQKQAEELERRQIDLNLQEDSLRERDCELTTCQDKWQRTRDELNAEFETAKQEFLQRTKQRDEHLESLAEALSGREESLADHISKTESRKISLDQQWDELKTKNQTLTEEMTLLEERKSSLADEQSRLKREQNLSNEAQSQFSEERKQFDEARKTFRLDRKRLEKDQNGLSQKRTSLDTDTANFENEKSQLEVELGKLADEQARIAEEQKEISVLRDTLAAKINCFEKEKSEFKLIQFQIRENLLLLTKDYESFSKQREALEKEKSQFQVEQETFTAEQDALEADQAQLADEQIDVCEIRAAFDKEQNKFNTTRALFATERTRFKDEQSQFEEERRLLKEDQTRLCEELKDFDEKRKGFEQQQEIQQSEIYADREGLDRERIDLKGREAKLAESTNVFNTQREELASQQDQLEDDFTKLDDDLQKLRKEQESLGSARQELSQDKEDLEVERKKLRARTEEFEFLQDEWKQRQEADSATICRDDLSESDDDSTEPADPPLPRVLSTSTLSSDTDEISDTGPDALKLSPVGVVTEAEILSKQIIPIEKTDDSLSISKYMEDLLARSRKLQSARHSNMDAETDETATSSLLIEDPEHATVPENNKSDHSFDAAQNKEKRVTEEILVPFDPDNPPAPFHPQDADALRFDLTTLRDVANHSARSAIAQHTSEQMRGKILVKTLLSVIGFSIAAVTLSSELWLNVSYKAFGIAAAAIAAISVLEVIRSTLLVHEMGTLKQESLHNSAVEDVFAEDICEENELEGELDGTAENNELADILEMSEPNGSLSTAQESSLTHNSHDPKFIVLDETDDGDDVNLAEKLFEQESIEENAELVEIDETPDEDLTPDEQVSMIPGDETLSEQIDEPLEGTEAELN